MPLAFALAACAPPSLRTSFRDGRELVQTAVDARELDAVRVDAGVADLEMVAEPGDSVRVRVTLRSSDAARLERECLPNSTLETRREGRAVAFRVEQRTRNRCGAVWRVSMPARLDATARVSVGSIRISGLAGAIDAATSTGDIVVLSRAPSHGDVTVRADVGDVKARVRGYDVPPPRAYGAGAAMTLRGSGGPAISIRAGVGDASLEIGEP